MNKQQHQQLIDRLKELHLPMFREYHQEFAQTALANELGYEEYLDELAQRECEVRRANKINRLCLASIIISLQRQLFLPFGCYISPVYSCSLGVPPMGGKILDITCPEFFSSWLARLGSLPRSILR